MSRGATACRITRQCTGPEPRVYFPSVERGAVPARQLIGPTLFALGRCMFKRVSIAIVIVAAIAVAAMLYSRTRPVTFTPAAWKTGDDKLRFRMKDSLRAAYSSGAFPNRAAFDGALGPDDELGNDPGYRYFRLTEWYDNPWYLRVRFDEQGNVQQFLIAPD